MADKELRLLARCAYARMCEEEPTAKDSLNVTLLMEIIQRQGLKDPKTRHKLDFTRVRVFRKNESSPLVWRNAEVRNGDNHG